MPLKPLEELYDLDFPETNINDEDIAKRLKEDSKKYGGPVRWVMGRIHKHEAYEAWRKQILSTPLP